jgi:hypothetical protein
MAIMNLIEFLTGKFDYKFWKNRVSLIFIGEFLVTLLLAWVLRPIWVSDEWIYFPFVNYISELGFGRTEGNIGAWIFMIGFCLFPILGTAWNSYLARQFGKVSKFFAIILWLVFELSLWCVALVGIFDVRWPEPGISMFFHVIGATYAFMGNTIAAVLVFIFFAIVYWTTPKDQRNMPHPFKFFLVIVELVGVYLIFRIFPNPFWQWMIMLSLLTFVLANSRLFPEKLKK